MLRSLYEFENSIQDAGDLRRLSMAGLLLPALMCHGIPMAQATDWITEAEWLKQPVVLQNFSAAILRRRQALIEIEAALKKLNSFFNRLKKEFRDERTASDHGSSTLSKVLEPLEVIAATDFPKNLTESPADSPLALRR